MKKTLFSIALSALFILSFVFVACNRNENALEPTKSAPKVRKDKNAPIGFSSLTVNRQFLSTTGIVEENATENFTYTRNGVSSTGQLFFSMDEDGAIIDLAIDNGTLSNVGLTPEELSAQMEQGGGGDCSIAVLIDTLEHCDEQGTRGDRRKCRRRAWIAFVLCHLVD